MIIYKVVRLCRSMSLMRGRFTHTAPPFIDSLLPLNYSIIVASLSFRDIHADCYFGLASCMPLPLLRLHYTCLSTKLIPMILKFLMEERGQEHNLSPLTLSLVNSGIGFLCLYFLLQLTWTLSLGKSQDTTPKVSGLSASKCSAAHCLPEERHNFCFLLFSLLDLPSLLLKIKKEEKTWWSLHYLTCFHRNPTIKQTCVPTPANRNASTWRVSERWSKPVQERRTWKRCQRR